MSTSPSPLALWESGRLAPRARARFNFSSLTREQGLGAVLLVMAGGVFAAFVSVLEHDVARGEQRQQALHARALARSDCERTGQRSACLALLREDTAVALAPEAALADATSSSETGSTR